MNGNYNNHKSNNKSNQYVKFKYRIYVCLWGLEVEKICKLRVNRNKKYVLKINHLLRLMFHSIIAQLYIIKNIK